MSGAQGSLAAHEALAELGFVVGPARRGEPMPRAIGYHHVFATIEPPLPVVVRGAAGLTRTITTSASPGFERPAVEAECSALFHAHVTHAEMALASARRLVDAAEEAARFNPDDREVVEMASTAQRHLGRLTQRCDALGRVVERLNRWRSP